MGGGGLEQDPRYTKSQGFKETGSMVMRGWIAEKLYTSS